MNLPPGQGDAPETDKNAPAFNLPFVVTITIALLFLIHLAAEMVLTPESYRNFFLQFGYIAQRDLLPSEFRGGELARYYTLFSHAFLHGGWQHLLFNIAWLAVFGSPIARRYGNLGYVGVFFFGSALGAIVFAYFTGANFAILIGASGAISALIGGATRFVFQPVQTRVDEATGEVHVLGRKLATLTEIVKNKRSLSFAGFWLGLNIVFGLMPGLMGVNGAVAWQAHLGGYVAGYFMVAWLERRPF